MNKAVVLGSNYYIGLSIIRCLGREGVKVSALDYSSKNSYALSTANVPSSLASTL